MIYIFLSICCNITVGVLFKLARRYSINAEQAIVFSYLMAIVLTSILFTPRITPIAHSSYPVYLLLGFLLPAMFVVIARSIRYTGIVKTDVAQRLSLFIPLIAAYLLFNEAFSVSRISGIALGLIAITCSIPWRKKETKVSKQFVAWMYPVIVFIGMGIIDILFKQIAQHVHVPFTSALLIIYILAFLISGIVMLYLMLLKKSRFEWINFMCGIILGIFNFGNIYYYLKAHQALSKTPSVVFSSMNVGVIVLGSFVGIVLFKEKLSRLNYIGIALAIISILIISFA